MIGEGTEETVEALRAFLAGKYNTYLETYRDSETPMCEIAGDCIAMGGDDLSRFDNKKIIAVIIPESEDRADGHISGTAETVRLTVSFLCRGYAHSVLLRQMFRYTAALRRAMEADFTLDNKVQNCEAGKTDFFPNAGSVDKQMTAAETDIIITLEHEREDDDFDDIFI